ncbi:MAG TPA: universal stress protein [Micropepsaceae bacterium]|nr:universal stress protein [Micropepsaceae bacterium]
MKRILVATDGSIGAGRALDAASELAKDTGAELMIVNVEQGYLNEDLEQLRKSEKASADEILYAVSTEILTRAQAHAASRGVSKIRTFSGLGDAVGYILELTHKEQPDLIVAGKRGRGRLAGLLIGSVSQKLVSLAPCKVMVVP